MDYEMDFNGWIMAILPNIHANNYIPQEVKDAWIELALINNIEQLYESAE
jgi:hypothetical protein